MIVKTLQLGTNPACTLECMLHERDRNQSPRPSVIVCPGGGYAMLTPNEGSPIAAAFFARGFHAFVLNYSLGFRAMWPQTEVEASLAIMTLRAHAEEWNLDPNAIAIGGFSAGGSMAANAGTYWNDPAVQAACGAQDRENRPDAMILIYPAAKIEMPTVMNGRLETIEIDPAARVNADTPPAFLAHTYCDNVVSVDQSLHFARALSENDVPAEMHIYTTGEHGTLSRAMNPDTDLGERTVDFSEWIERCCEWLRDRFYRSRPISEIPLIVTPFGDNRRKKGIHLKDLLSGRSPFMPPETDEINAFSSLGRFLGSPAAMQVIYSYMPQLEMLELDEAAAAQPLDNWLTFAYIDRNDPAREALFAALRQAMEE